jgi:hypothetical protein
LSIIVTCCILKLSVTVPAINLWIVTWLVILSDLIGN